MNGLNCIIQDEQPDDKDHNIQPALSLVGLLDLLHALGPDLEVQGGLVSLFAGALREDYRRPCNDSGHEVSDPTSQA
jgi:hypothetical protein